MNLFRCYTRDELKEFILGKLNSEASAAISEHLDQCNDCEDTVVSLEHTVDNLLDVLSKANNDHDVAPPIYQDNPDYHRAFSVAKGISGSLEDSADEAEPMSPARIGDYEIVSTLARGGMGSVFKARHTRLEKEVAIKILPERKMQSRDAIARFSREMKIIGKMSHPSMVAATDAGTSNGIHYLVMELVDGMDLGKIVRRCGSLGIAEGCELVRQAAMGIQYAHDEGVIHRDVKPSNLMLTEDSIVKVLDLGLATLGGLTGTVDELTTVGQLMGTLDYMAPEQCGNSNEVDGRTDIYGLGATLYKLLAGVAPYSSPDNDTPLKKLKAMAISQPVPIANRLKDVPGELAEIINRCLAREPGHRFETAVELADTLKPFTEGHQLAELLKRTQLIGTDDEKQINEPKDSPLVQNNQSLPIKKSHTAPVPPVKQTGSGWAGRFFRAAILLAGFGFAGWAGIVLYLNTTSGQLIIESEVDDIRVTVLKNEAPAKDLQIEHGAKSTRLRAGEYRVVINGDSDSLTIENDQFLLKRGETVVARITKRESPETKGFGFESQVADPGVLSNDQLVGREFYNKRIYDLQMKIATFRERLTEKDHPAIVQLQELVADSQRKINIGQQRDDYYENQLYELLLDRAHQLMPGNPYHMLLKSVDAKIAAHREFMKKREDQRNLGLTPTNPLIDSVKDTAFDGPTYMGKNIEAWIETNLTGEVNGYNPNVANIQRLQKALKVGQAEAIANEFIEKYKNEVAVAFHAKLVKSLAPLCKEESVLERVFDHALNVIGNDESADYFRYSSSPFRAFLSLEVNNPIGVERKMLQLLDSKNLKHRALAAAWAQHHVAVKVKPPLPSGWSDALLRRLNDEESIKLNACRALALQFGDQPNVVEAFYKIMETGQVDEILAVCIKPLLSGRPDDRKVAAKMTQLVEAGFVPAKSYVLQAVNNAAVGDERLQNEIVTVLTFPNWGLKLNVADQAGRAGIGARGRRGGAGLAERDGPENRTTRQVLVRELGKLGGDGKVFLPALYKQFEIPFVELPETAKKTLYDEANEAIAKIVGVGKYYLYQGYDIDQWLDRFLESDAEPAKLKALQGIVALKNSLNDPRELVLAVVPKLRGISFDQIDFEDKDSIQTVAISLFPPPERITRRNSEGTLTYSTSPCRTTTALFDVLDELEDADAMFALWVMHQSNCPRRDDVGTFVRNYLSADDPLLRRRAIFVWVRSDNVANERERNAVVSQALQADDFDEETKLAILQLFSSRYPVRNVTLTTEDPGQIAALLGRFNPRPSEDFIEPVVYRLLAENSDFLDEVHQPCELDLWGNAATKQQALIEPTKLTLFEQVLNYLDAKFLASGPRMSSRQRPEPSDQTTQAIKNLKQRYTTSTGSQKRKLERVIRRLDPEWDKESGSSP